MLLGIKAGRKIVIEYVDNYKPLFDDQTELGNLPNVIIKDKDINLLNECLEKYR